MIYGQVALYLEDYSDEIMPCDATPEGWAAWLSAPDQLWNRAEAATPGDRFPGYTMTFRPDIVAKRQPDGSWSFDREPADGDEFFAIRFAQGLGWDPDNICADSAAVRDRLTELDADNLCDDVEYIAVAGPMCRVMVTFNDRAPLTIEAVQ